MTQQEQQKEAQINSLSSTAIGATPYGALIGMMRSVTSAGEGMIPHKVCLSKNGGEIKVYNTRSSKLIAAFLKPTHEYVQKYIAQKKYGEAALSLLGIYGQLKSVQEQEAAKCFTVTPSDFLKQQAKKEAEQNAINARKQQDASDANKRKLTTEFYKSPNFWLILVGIILLIFITVALMRKKSQIK
jgi:hypothetical protein